MSTCASNAGATLNREDLPRDVPVTETRARKLRSDCKVTDPQLFDSIVAHFGILAYVALAVGISRAALYKRIDRAADLQAARDAARAVVVAVAREQLALAVYAGKPWATMFCISAGQPCAPAEPYGQRESSVSAVLREPRQPKELVAEPQLANSATLKLVHGVERGEAWAVKYCLTNLEPGGEYAKKPRVRRDGSSAEQLEAPRQPSAESCVESPRLYDAELVELTVAHYAALVAEIASETRRKPLAEDATAHDMEAVAEIQSAPTELVETATQKTSARCGLRANRSPFELESMEPGLRKTSNSPVSAAPTVTPAPTVNPNAEPTASDTRANHHSRDPARRALQPQPPGLYNRSPEPSAATTRLV